jgi:hypothetical protein
MKICFITSNGFTGKVPVDYKNCRTEYAWTIALNADNMPIELLLHSPSIDQNYDLGIVILPKKTDGLNFSDLLTKSRLLCKQLAVMQEGPQWYFQDYKYFDQINFVNFVSEMDFLLVHNKSDIAYFKGIFKLPVFNLQSLIIEDTLTNVDRPNQKNGCPIIGGNFCSWYSGFDSYIVATNFKQPIYVPSMGRKIEHEEHFPGINHLPYMQWFDWMVTLKDFSYGVHLMRTRAAGTFALNCAYWGIPCIGYYGLDTQQILHPDLSVDTGDIESANKLAIQLRDDKYFYNQCVETTKTNYQKYYTEQVWWKQWKEISDNINDISTR